ncbi:MAG: hypothetical protein AABY00_01345 [Nanoarchaeota archaeon]
MEDDKPDDNKPVEVILLEYECRDYGSRAFVLRIKNTPWGASRIQQVVWGVSYILEKENPPLFPIYYNVTGFNKGSNDLIMAVPFEGRLADIKPSFDEAVVRAYELAKKWAEAYFEPSSLHPEYDPSRARMFDRTRFANPTLPDSDDPCHKLWYKTAWFPEI